MRECLGKQEKLMQFLKKALLNGFNKDVEYYALEGESFMKCQCGGILNVIKIENPPEHLNKQEKLLYNRLCDVQCLKCGIIYYSQPYDFGKRLNKVRDLNNN